MRTLTGNQSRLCDLRESLLELDEEIDQRMQLAQKIEAEMAALQCEIAIQESKLSRK